LPRDTADERARGAPAAWPGAPTHGAQRGSEAAHRDPRCAGGPRAAVAPEVGAAAIRCKTQAVKRAQRPVLITDAEQSPAEELRRRQTRYIVMMLVRTACLILAAVLAGM